MTGGSSDKTGGNSTTIDRVLAGRYRLSAIIGVGGMGHVYRATQLSMERAVAVKILRPDICTDLESRDVWIARFRREVDALSRLQHPNTVTVHDYGESQDGECFIVMEMLTGATLGSLQEGGASLEAKRVIRIARQVARSLAEAHSHGIVHRDLKPDNIFLTSMHGEEDFIKVVDFGIAKILEGADIASITSPGLVPGTPAFMSPEQAAGDKVDHRTDIYTLGAIMFALLAGRPPFNEESPVKVLVAQMKDPPPLMEEVAPKVQAPAALLDLVYSCLEKKPGDRPQTAERVIELLDAIPLAGTEQMWSISDDQQITGPGKGVNTADFVALMTTQVAAASPEEPTKPMEEGKTSGSAWRRRFALAGGAATAVLVAWLLLRFLGGGLVVDYFGGRVAAAGSVSKSLEEWRRSRTIVGGLFTPHDTCGLDLAMLKRLEERVKTHSEECAVVPESLFLEAGVDCTDVDRQAKPLLHLARFASYCRRGNFVVMDPRAVELLEYYPERPNRELAELFFRLGKSYYYRVFRKEFSSAEERRLYLQKSLSWSQNAIVELKGLTEDSDVILWNIRSRVNIASALKLMHRYAEAEARLREALALALDKKDDYYDGVYDRVTAPIYFNLSLLLCDWGNEEDLVEAETYLKRAEKLYAMRDGSLREIYLDRVRSQCSDLYSRTGRFGRAVELAMPALRSRKERLARADDSKLAVRQVEYARALTNAVRALSECVARGLACGPGPEGQLEEVRQWLEEFDGNVLPEEYQRGMLLLVRAAACAASGDPGGCRDHYMQALPLLDGDDADQEQVADHLVAYRSGLEKAGEEFAGDAIVVQQKIVSCLVARIREVSTFSPDVRGLSRTRNKLAAEWEHLQSMCRQYGVERPVKELSAAIKEALQ